ncbi:hypothetical protein ACIRO3_33300 [Streptomyces sp. NPDC102278]|uniref:hypothetical protein n=1 Tax=Streptomyces sp. NPDC102278 TaxID=3366152 RepID=UPI00380195C5
MIPAVCRWYEVSGGWGLTAERRVVLDVTATTFADSSMLNTMLLLLRAGRLVLAGPMPTKLGRLLDITQARELFPTADTVDAARTL